MDVDETREAGTPAPLQARFSKGLKEAPLLSTPHGLWRDAWAEIYETRGFDPDDAYSYASDIIAFTLTGVVQQEYRRFGRLRTESNSAGEFAVFPAGFEHRGRAVHPLSFVKLHVESALLERVGEDVTTATRAKLRPSIAVRNEAVYSLGRLLDLEVRSGCPGGSLYGDAIVTLLCLHLLRSHLNSQVAAEPRYGGLPAWKLRRVEEFVDTNLAREIRLAELAGVVHLSPYHFLHAFKQETGTTPHQYVTAKRMKAAKELLARTDLPVIQVAARVGYLRASHFCATFKLYARTTPTEFRRSLA